MSKTRFLALEARCSTPAVALLRSLEGHPKLTEMTEMLELIDGTILRNDIELALAAATSRQTVFDLSKLTRK